MSKDNKVNKGKKNDFNSVMKAVTSAIVDVSALLRQDMDYNEQETEGEGENLNDYFIFTQCSDEICDTEIVEGNSCDDECNKSEYDIEGKDRVNVKNLIKWKSNVQVPKHNKRVAKIIIPETKNQITLTQMYSSNVDYEQGEGSKES